MDYTIVKDSAFLEQVREGRIDAFGHREHLRLAFLSARASSGLDEVVERCRAGIRSVASAQGAPDRYHETITASWAAIMLHAARSLPGAGFEEVLAAHPELADTRHLERYYSPARLGCNEARTGRLAPDRAPLP